MEQRRCVIVDSDYRYCYHVISKVRRDRGQNPNSVD